MLARGSWVINGGGESFARFWANFNPLISETNAYNGFTKNEDIYGEYLSDRGAAWQGVNTVLFFLLAVKFGNVAKSVTTADRFLFGGVTVRTPFNISVQRFGNKSLSRVDYWELKVGTNRFINRTFVAIKPSWNPLVQYTTGVIPKGTQIKIGIIGSQGWMHPGSLLQFLVPSRKVIDQSSKIIIR